MLIILVALFALLWWWRLHPYVVTREQMQTAMERMLRGEMPASEWYRLIRKRISRDRYLDSLRQRLFALPMRREENGPLYEATAMEEISKLLDELRRKRP